MEPHSSRAIFRRWLFLALAIRCISAGTHASWFHPDEWYQTVELANQLLHGFSTYTQEVSLHLRNLSWPFALTAPLWLADRLAPGSIGLRVDLFQLLTGALDALMVWGWWRMTEALIRKRELPLWFVHLGFALLVAPYFTVADCVRPSSEHLSAIALWVALGLMADRRWLAAGVASVAIAAMRYPSGLLAAGLALGVLAQGARDRDWRRVWRYAGGCALGLAIFGIPDWVVYGRPWESLWMYLQYNVFTGLGARVFGHQSASIYWEFLGPRWGGGLFAPIGICLGGLAAWALVRALRRLEPWSLALVLYVAGHLLVGHKEARFAWPVEGLLLWAGYEGFSLWMAENPKYRRLRDAFSRPGLHRKLAAALILALVSINAALVLRALWGETWVPNETYFEVGRHLRETPRACAVITVRWVPSVLWPWSDPARAPEPALGVFYQDRHGPGFEQAAGQKLQWMGHGPSCPPDGELLLQVHRPEAEWAARGCELLPSGFLGVLPRPEWGRAMALHLAAGSWYRCPASVLGEFKHPEVASDIVARGLPRFDRLPPLGITGDELLRTARVHDSLPRDFKETP